VSVVDLPVMNAALNTTSTVLLLLGYVAIRRVSVASTSG
jgi:energy-converting hydrogenase Eha subunit C